MHRPAAVRIEQELDGLTAARTYGEAGDRQARELAHQQAEAIARLTTHAIELAEDAGWGRRRIEDRLDAVVRNTAIERIVATGADGSVVYQAGRRSNAGGQPHTEPEEPRNDENEASAGRYDSLRRWIARASATRANRRLNATVEIATRAGRGGIADSAWQSEANRLAGVEGITGIWVAQVDEQGVRLAAAAPGPGRGTAGATDAWTRWDEDLGRLAAETAKTEDTRSRTAIRLFGRQRAIVRTAARRTNDTEQTAIAVVIEQRADTVLQRMRRDAGQPHMTQLAPPPPARRTTPESLLDGLNDEQRTTVRHPGGPLLILARPGSGKTRANLPPHRLAGPLRDRAGQQHPRHHLHQQGRQRDARTARPD